VKIEKICQQHNLFSLKDTLLTELTQTEVFPNLSEMKTTHRRGKHYKSLKNYIHPVKIVLGTDDYHHTCFFHYVPVLDTIKNYLNGTNLSEFLKKPRINEKKNYGRYFRRNYLP
jgi:trans-aconitate methyltransferase